MAPIAQFSGLASGIDSSSLIKALVDAKLKTNELRKKKVSDLESENDALEELNSKIIALNDLIDKFRTAKGGGVSKRSASSDASVASAAVTSAASNSTLGVTVTSVASAGVGSFIDSYADGNALFAPNTNASTTATITVQVGTGANQANISVDVTNTTTVQQFVDAFNSNSSANGRANASIVKIAENDYRVVISSLKTGLADGQLAFVVPSSASFGGSSNLQNTTLDQATNAVFNVSGIGSSITRTTNSISDLLSGVTLQITKTGTASITVTDDAETTADSFKEIFDAFNDIVSFVKENSTITQDKSSKDGAQVYGSLASTRVDDNLLSAFRENLLGAVSSSSGAVQSSGDLGIITNRDGTISIDMEKFKSAVSSDSTGATDLLRNFADASAGVSGFIYQYTTYQGFIDGAQSSNLSQIDNINSSIEQLERSAEKMRQRYTLTFARLESVTAELQRKQAELTSALGGK